MKDTGLGDSLDVVRRKGKEGFWEDRSYGSIFVQEKAFVVLDIFIFLLPPVLLLKYLTTTTTTNKKRLWLYRDHQWKVNLLHDP